jgi:hypothetical protein
MAQPDRENANGKNPEHPELNTFSKFIFQSSHRDIQTRGGHMMMCIETQEFFN